MDVNASEIAHVPVNYKTVKFDDVANKVDINVDRTTTSLDRYVAGEHIRTDDLRITEWGNIGKDYLGPAFYKMFKAGQILYLSRNPHLRKVAVPSFDGICANTTFVIEPSGEELLSELLAFVLQSSSFTEHAIRESKGSTNPYVNWKDIAKFTFQIPSNLGDQRKSCLTITASEN